MRTVASTITVLAQVRNTPKIVRWATARNELALFSAISLCRCPPPFVPDREKSSRGERPDFGLALRIVQVAQLSACAARDLRHLVAGLEAGEIRAVLPGEGAAQLRAGLDRGIVHDVDGALVVGRALCKARKIAEVAARGEHRRDAGHLGDLV